MLGNAQIKIGAFTLLALLVLGLLLWPLPSEAHQLPGHSAEFGHDPPSGLNGILGDNPEGPFPAGSPVRSEGNTEEQIIARTDAVIMPLGATEISIDVLDNDVHPNNDHAMLSVSEVLSPRHGEATILANGNVRYTPETGFFGQDSFHYFVTDGTLSSLGSVQVTVPDPDAPKWEVTWEDSRDEGESATLRVIQANPSVTVDEEKLLGVTLHVGFAEGTGNTDDIIVRDHNGEILPEHLFTRNIHHEGAMIYITDVQIKDAKVATMTIEAIDDSDGEETLALWSYVDGYLAGVGTLTIKVPE